MAINMKPPCEMVVWYIIPAIRSELAKDLLKLGMIDKTIKGRVANKLAVDHLKSHNNY